VCGLAALVGTMLLEQGGGEPPNADGLLRDVVINSLWRALADLATAGGVQERFCVAADCFIAEVCC
jgi:hypothetical protein